MQSASETFQRLSGKARLPFNISHTYRFTQHGPVKEVAERWGVMSERSDLGQEYLRREVPACVFFTARAHIAEMS